MCCSDLDVGARLDVLDLDPVVPPDMLVSDGGLVWMNTAGRLYVSRNEGQIFVLAYQGAECDGLTRSPFLNFSTCPPPLTNIRPLTEDEMRMFDDTPDPDERAWSNPTLTFEQEIPVSGSFKAAEPLPTMWWYRRMGASEWTLSKDLPNPTDPGSWEVVACTSARVVPVRFDNTPPPLRPIPPEKVEAARKAIDAITARAKGLAGIEWPAGWIPSAVCPGYRIGPRDAARLPNTERGRRAAWELEGA